jgi:plasmid stability protein
VADVLVRNLSAQTVELLKARAAARGVSLNAFLRDVLESATPLSIEDRLAALEAVRARIRPGGPCAVDLIRADRDNR